MVSHLTPSNGLQSPQSPIWLPLNSFPIALLPCINHSSHTDLLAVPPIHTRHTSSQGLGWQATWLFLLSDKFSQVINMPHTHPFFRPMLVYHLLKQVFSLPTLLQMQTPPTQNTPTLFSTYFSSINLSHVTYQYFLYLYVFLSLPPQEYKFHESKDLGLFVRHIYPMLKTGSEIQKTLK